MSESSSDPEPTEGVDKPAAEPGGRPSWIESELEHGDLQGDGIERKRH